MKKWGKASVSAVTLWAGMLATSISYAAQVSIIHGINGTDLGLSESLPVDIEVNGGCLATGVTYQNMLDPLTLDAGEYAVNVRLSDGACQGVVAVTGRFAVQFGESSTIIAHASETSSPALSQFLNDARTPAAGEAKLSIRHTAAAPEVAIYVTQNRRVKALWPLLNGDKKAATLPAGHYNVYVVDQQRGFAKGVLAGPIPVDLDSETLTRIYAIGSLENGTFTVLPEVDVP